MPQLAAVVKSLEAVKPEDQAFYIQDGDSFVLDTEKYFAGMSSARDKEKEEARKAKEQLQKFQGIDPEAAKLALAKVQEMQDKQRIDAGKIDEVVAERVQNQVQAMKTDLETRLGAAEQRANQAEAQLSVVIVDNNVRIAAVKANVLPEAMDDILFRASRVFRVEGGKAVPKDGDNIIYGKDGKTPMTMDDWMEGLKVKAPHLFKRAEGSGGGRPGAGSGGTGLEGLTGVEKLKAVRRQQNTQ